MSKFTHVQKFLRLNNFQQIKKDLNLITNEFSENFGEENSAKFSDNDSENSSNEKIDKDQLFFNQKRERIKRKIEGEASKTNEKFQFQKNSKKNKNTNFIEKNSNLIMIKDKSQTKRLNGLSVRINKDQNDNMKINEEKYK